MRVIAASIAVILAIGSAYIYESSRNYKSAQTGTPQPTAQTRVELKPMVNWAMVSNDWEYFTQPADATTPIKTPEAAASPAPPPTVPTPHPRAQQRPTSAERETPAAAPAQHPRGGWMIQIGAFANEGEAKEHLKAARNKAPSLLGKADSFTERVVKYSRELYRARFAGLNREGAEAACHYFQRNNIACMALKN
jgi:cell division septation protein DedD